jgi:hypothetical protein
MPFRSYTRTQSIHLINTNYPLGSRSLSYGLPLGGGSGTQVVLSALLFVVLTGAAVVQINIQLHVPTFEESRRLVQCICYVEI